MPGLGDATTRLERTGSCEYGWRGVVAGTWPADGRASTMRPVVAAVYLTGTTLSIDQRNAVIAEVGAAVARGLAPQDGDEARSLGTVMSTFVKPKTGGM